MSEPSEHPAPEQPSSPSPTLWTVGCEWGRLGCIGFGGPPTHIKLLRELCVTRRGWLDPAEFEDAIATCNLLPGPASTQLAIFCAWKVRGPTGALVGGCAFIAPGLILILALAAVFLANHAPGWVLGAAAGAGAAVPAVALHAASGLVPASWKRIGTRRSQRWRWLGYAMIGAVAGAAIGPYLVLVLLTCGLIEIIVRRPGQVVRGSSAGTLSPAVIVPAAAVGGLGAVAWVAFKVGALSYGGGFVIIPLMQHDAVNTYHWMSDVQFLNAVALGQITPGPVVQTVAAIGYAAAGVGGGLLAAVIAFAPSFLFVLIGAPRFDRIRANTTMESFLTGAGPAVIGAIAGSAIPLGLALQQWWQIPVLAGALLWLFAIHRGVVGGLLLAGACGTVVALAGVTI
jgi:chromate transporter